MLKVPEERVLRPFFFMRLIQKSISEGAFLSSSLFVPKLVWHQKAAKISDIERKMQFFSELRRELRSVSQAKKQNQMSKDFRQVEPLVTYVVRLTDEIRQIVSQDENAISARYARWQSFELDQRLGVAGNFNKASH